MSKITETRNKTHGNFTDNARISQQNKEFLRNQPGWVNLTNIQKEALDMICLKVSRIVSGKSWEKDHWVDIAGYADLAVQELEEK